MKTTSTRLGVFCAAAILMALVPVSTRADVIDFDSLPDGTVVTNQFPQATFSSSAGNENVAFSHSSAQSSPNILCTRPVGGSISCIEDTYIDFTQPVNNLTFWAIEANVSGNTALFNVYQNGVYSASVPLVGGGGNVFVDLSAFTNVTRLEIVNILNDPGARSGIGWDTFTFTPNPTGVPAVSPRGLVAVGLLLMAALTGMLLWARR